MTLKVMTSAIKVDWLNFYCYFPYFFEGYYKSPLAFCPNSNINPPYCICIDKRILPWHWWQFFWQLLWNFTLLDLQYLKSLIKVTLISKIQIEHSRKIYTKNYFVCSIFKRSPDHFAFELQQLGLITKQNKKSSCQDVKVHCNDYFNTFTLFLARLMHVFRQ
jgi:hypothetical protein